MEEKLRELLETVTNDFLRNQQAVEQSLTSLREHVATQLGRAPPINWDERYRRLTELVGLYEQVLSDTHVYLETSKDLRPFAIMLRAPDYTTCVEAYHRIATGCARFFELLGEDYPLVTAPELFL